jgi:hypothetical protein
MRSYHANPSDNHYNLIRITSRQRHSSAVLALRLKSQQPVDVFFETGAGRHWEQRFQLSSGGGPVTEPGPCLGPPEARLGLEGAPWPSHEERGPCGDGSVAVVASVSSQRTLEAIGVDDGR